MSKQLSPAEQALREAALEYHRTPVRGKIAVTPTKPLSNPVSYTHLTLPTNREV